ncbi:MAG: isocitrate lyase/PEP mutase family protein [Dehalococcoidia bacterium]|nr:isocitrate lyase/PEP mutase family protein [Dehalococcoidia bacterium]
MKKSKRLRELFDSGKVFTIAGGSCAFHAKMAEAAGFECAYMSGGFTSSFLLGIPDAGIMTLTEMVENARRMARATSIPLLCDADQGYGNALNVRHTVEAFIGAGVAGIHLEDQPVPKRCGFVSGKEVISLEEAAGKYRAAVDARDELDPDFVILARCDARTAVGGSLEETIRRLKAYEEAGVDVLYFEAPQSMEELRAARAAVSKPLMCTWHAIGTPELSEMEDLGIAAHFLPGLLNTPAMLAAWDFAHEFKARGMAALREQEERYKDHPLANLRHFEFLGFDKLREWEEQYLPAEAVSKYEKSVGVYEPGRV